MLTLHKNRGIVTVVIILICAWFAHAKFSGADPDATKSTHQAELEYNAVLLQKVISNLQANQDFDLSQIRDVSTSVFKSEHSINSYFEASDSLIFPWKTIDSNVHSKDIERLNEALLKHSVNAAKRSDWSRSRLALALAIEVSTLPMNLTPPAEVLWMGEEKIPGFRVFRYSYQPALRSLSSLESAVAAMGLLSKDKVKNRAFEKTKMLVQSLRKEVSAFKDSFKRLVEEDRMHDPQWIEVEKRMSSRLKSGLSEIKSGIETWPIN